MGQLIDKRLPRKWHWAVDNAQQACSHWNSSGGKTGGRVKLIPYHILSDTQHWVERPFAPEEAAPLSFISNPWGKKELPSWLFANQTISRLNCNTLQTVAKGVFTRHGGFPCCTWIMDFNRYYHRKYLNPAEIPIFPVPVLTALNSPFVLINFFQCTLTYDPV